LSKEVDSDALVEMKRVLGIAGPGSGSTELEDGSIVQVIDVAPIVRRSRTLGGSTGIHYGILQNEHAASGALTATIDPYRPDGNRVAPYPLFVTRQLALDVWLLGASVLRQSGVAALNGATLTMTMAAELQAWGENDDGTQELSTGFLTLGIWDSFSTAPTVDTGLTEQGASWLPINMRVPRGAALAFTSDLDAAGDVHCQMLIGLFPTSLGQDAVT